MFDRRTPDLRHGVFETLLVVNGRPVEPAAHLARLEASLAELYPDEEPPVLNIPGLRHPYGRLSPGMSADDELGVLRIIVAPTGEGRLGAQIERRKAPPGGFMSPSGTRAPEATVSLSRLPLAGGLGEHKWADRSLLDQEQARLPADTLPLLVDRDGAVLEASRANVFAVREGTLLTPPLDGRILPGITRARVMEIAPTCGLRTREVDLDCEQLLAANEVFLTGSVRGIERVGSVDGTDLDAGGGLASRLAEKLRRSWGGAFG